MNTVVGHSFQALLDTAEAAGVDTRAAVVAVFPAGTIEPAERYPWDRYAELGDALAGLFASDEEVIEVFSGWAPHMPGLAASVQHIRDPMELARLVTASFSIPDKPALVTAQHELAHDRYRYEQEILPGYRGSRGGALISAGLLRGQPTLIGLPGAHVEIVVATARRFVANVTLPPMRERSALLPTLSPGKAQQAIAFLGRMTRERDEQRRLGDALLTQSQHLGAELATAPTAEAAGRLVVRHAAETLGASHALLWIEIGRASKVLAVHGERDQSSRTLPLQLGPRLVGSLELPANADTRALEPLLPLVARVLAARLDAPTRWRLSATELRVAELLARGGSNAAIAGALGIAVETAAEHVARVLAKSGAKRRAEVVALWRQATETPRDP